MAQKRYATVLAVTGRAGLILLVVSFSLYVLGVIEPAVPIRQLPEYWGLPVQDYLEEVNSNHLHLDEAPYGWSWLCLLGKGDFLNFLGVAALGMVTIVCYVSILPTLYRQRRRAYTLIALLQIAILILAASGLLTAGH